MFMEDLERGQEKKSEIEKAKQAGKDEILNALETYAREAESRLMSALATHEVSGLQGAAVASFINDLRQNFLNKKRSE